MDGMTYLNQISTSSAHKRNAGIFSPNIIKWLILGVILAVAIIIGGAIFSNLNFNQEKDETTAQTIGWRMTNLINTIDTYSPSVKASGLRAITRTFAAVMTNTVNEITNVIGPLRVEPENSKEEYVPTKVETEESDYITSINDTLQTAYLNGYLDREYLNQMKLQITLLISLETEVISQTENAELQAVMSDSLANLENVQAQIEEYKLAEVQRDGIGRIILWHLL